MSLSIHEFRRDLQNVIGAKANLNLGPTIENYGGETFLSQEVAINLLQESKLGFRRCQNVRKYQALFIWIQFLIHFMFWLVSGFQLSSRIDLPNNATLIFDILVQYLLIEHMEYALELGLQGMQDSNL